MTSDVEARSAVTRPVAPRRASRPARERADQLGSWPAILAWGAGLIVTALGAGALTGNDLTPVAIRVLGAPLVLAGLATVAWGTAALTRGTIPLPRTAVAGCVVVLGLVIAFFAIDPVGTSIGAAAAASVLVLALAMLVAFRLRRPARTTRTGIAGILVAACVVAALTGPALTAASAARLTQGNDGVPVVIPGHH